MASTLVRGKYVISHATGRDSVAVIENGAVVQRDGRIVAIGPYPELARRHETDEVLGSPDHVVLPGLVNAHHHIGLTPVQRGILDQPLELWWVTTPAGREVDPYLDTLYGAFEMIESGVTTVQHIYGWPRGDVGEAAAIIDRVLKAYDDVGMRVSFALALRDQNLISLVDDESFLEALPAPLSGRTAALLHAWRLPLEAQIELFDQLHRDHNGKARSRVELAPGNLHWCSDRALARVQDLAERYRAPIHIHLLETPYQKEYARRRTGGSAFRHLHRLGMSGRHLTLGHGVWMTADDIELAAETDTRICHNCSSNMRLRSGIAPLNAFIDAGLTVALGIDEAGLNDDHDMLQEMRLVLKQHRVPGVAADAVPHAAEVFRMATEGGARTTPFDAEIGTLAPGAAADLCLLDWQHMATPYLDTDLPVIEAILHRAKSRAVDAVMVAGTVIYRRGRFTRVDREAILAELEKALAIPLSAEERERRRLARDLLPHVRAMYAEGWELRPDLRPFYRSNARD